MIEMHLLSSARETENKLRWDADIDKVRFSLYIPKWRVPEPWPEVILVGVSDQLGRYTDYSPLNRKSGKADSSLRKRPILAILHRVNDHTETIRYAPSGDPKDWEVGEPYIPYSLLPHDTSKTLLIEIRWDLG
jgi:hypothetical protein